MSSSLPSGTRLGRYEIRSQLGAGGMGEVYLAQDTNLDRKVALKILPTGVAAHPGRMKRFVQEAKAASALNHQLYRLKAAHRSSHLTLRRAIFLMLVGLQMERPSSTKSRAPAVLA